MSLVALSGSGQEEGRRRGREAGSDDHLLEPADPAVVQRPFREWEHGG